MDEDQDQRSLLICDHDAMRRSLLSAAARHAGLREAGEVGTYTDLLAMIDLVHPDVVLVDRRTPGLLGHEEIRDLVARAAPGSIVIVTDEPSSGDLLLGMGAVAVAHQGDLDSLIDALRRAIGALEAEHGHGAGRRTGADRRKQQDWSKVTSERRQGDRRRGGDRRDDPRGDEQAPGGAAEG